MKPLSKEDLAQINADLGQWLLQQLRELMRTLCPGEGDKELDDQVIQDYHTKIFEIYEFNQIKDCKARYSGFSHYTFGLSRKLVRLNESY